MPTTEHRGGIAMGSLIKQRAADTAGAPVLLQALKKCCWFSFSFALTEGFKQGLSGCQSDLWARAAKGSSRVLIGVSASKHKGQSARLYPCLFITLSPQNFFSSR